MSSSQPFINAPHTGQIAADRGKLAKLAQDAAGHSSAQTEFAIIQEIYDARISFCQGNADFQRYILRTEQNEILKFA